MIETRPSLLPAARHAGDRARRRATRDGAAASTAFSTTTRARRCSARSASSTTVVHALAGRSKTIDAALLDAARTAREQRARERAADGAHPADRSRAADSVTRAGERTASAADTVRATAGDASASAAGAEAAARRGARGHDRARSAWRRSSNAIPMHCSSGGSPRPPDRESEMTQARPSLSKLAPFALLALSLAGCALFASPGAAPPSLFTLAPRSESELPRELAAQTLRDRAARRAPRLRRIRAWPTSRAPTRSSISLDTNGWNRRRGCSRRCSATRSRATGASRRCRAPRARAPALRLETEIVALQQEFTEHPSRVRFALEARLLDGGERRLLAMAAFEAVEPSASEDPYGGVIAANGRSLACSIRSRSGAPKTAAAARVSPDARPRRKRPSALKHASAVCVGRPTGTIRNELLGNWWRRSG